MKNGSFRKWDHFDLTYSIWNYNPDLWTDSPDRHEEQQAAAIRWAFDLWSEPTSFRFERIEDGAVADIELQWIVAPDRGDHGWANPPPSSRGQKPEDGNVWFNQYHRWTFEPRETGEQPIDFLTLCAHELGHSIGLGHIASGITSLMRSPYGGSIRNLGLYELSCYTQLYQSHFFCSFFLEDAPGIRCP